MKDIKIFFGEPKELVQHNIESLNGITGLYFIFLKTMKVQYPFNNSRLIYIGMSEKRTNSIGNRLTSHYNGKSGNVGLVNYRKVDKLFFTHINFEMMKEIWQPSIEDLESYFILDFVEKYGVYPICNNKTGFEVLNRDIGIKLVIDWQYFE
ncbi:MAG: GIY-YIG nuclease family protein [Candidatus Aenigmarchaeota archaeon]|nr:GIY-YIG nuclease family protein [Candidatus Aenigmarchaeota archaeon]